MMLTLRAPVPAIALGITAGLASFLSLVTPAEAAAEGHGGAPASARVRAASVTNSDYFAGYGTAVAAGSATSSAAQFKVPALTCSSASRGITAVAGVEVNKSATYSAAFVVIQCQNGKASYFPGLVINGSETDYTTAPLAVGDVIKVSTKVTTKGTAVQVTDATKGVTKKLAGAGASSSLAYIGDSDWHRSKLLGVPSFGTLTFARCLVDGAALGETHPARYQRVDSSGKVQIATGALTSDGTAFATHFKHS